MRVAWNKGLKTGKLAPYKRGLTTTCKMCKKIVPRSGHKRFCSRICKCRHLSTLVGKKAIHWKGGRIKYCLDCNKQLALTSRPKWNRCQSCAAKINMANNPNHLFRKGLIGAANPSWIEDKRKLKRSGDAHKDRRSSAYKVWRKQVWLRDKYTCKIANPDCAGRIEAHHILGYTEYPELRYQINNGITLCHFHHPKRREEEKRLSPYFQELVSVSKEQI